MIKDTGNVLLGCLIGGVVGTIIGIGINFLIVLI